MESDLDELEMVRQLPGIDVHMNAMRTVLVYSLLKMMISIVIERLWWNIRWILLSAYE